MSDISKHFHLRSLDLFFALEALLGGVILISVANSYDRSAEVKSLNFVPPPRDLERFTFGYSESISDTLWLRVLQDIDVCEKVTGGLVGGELDRASSDRTGPACARGWVYNMIDAITTLAPKWKMPYRMGALLLSVVVDDIDGATLIFEKAVKQFPYDYNLLYTASYHYIWEVKNPERAAELLLSAVQHGGPSWFYSLAGKLYSEAGQAEMAKSVLENALSNMASAAKGRDRIEMRLDEVNKILQAEANKK